MKIRKNIYKTLFLSFFAAFLVASFSFVLYSLFTGGFSLAAVEDAWDGESVAKDFSSGNGTSDNPYIIHTPEEFIYFKQLIEGEEYSSYQDKYYALDNDLNFGEKGISGVGLLSDTEERIFKGHFDGRGHTLSNILINKAVEVDKVSYYSLFTQVKDAHVENVVINNYKVVTEETPEKVMISLFGNIGVHDLESEEKLSKFHDIIVQNIDIHYDENDSENVLIGIIGNNVSKGVLIHNISLDGKIIGNNKSHDIHLLSGELLGEVSNVIYHFDYEHVGDVSLEAKDIKNLYHMDSDKIFLGEEEKKLEDVLRLFNESISPKYYWAYDNYSFALKEYVEEEKIVEKVSPIEKEFSFSIRRDASPDITLHDSGVVGDTIYINDLTMDYNYYIGRNYTESSNGAYPSGNSSGKYSDSSLAKVYIAYRGEDINSSNTVGYVSLNEQVSNFIYYKYYPIENGTIKIPLIDNPYADRPNNRAFNGWITDYPGAVVSLDLDTYTRYVTIPASSEISITMYATWTEATVVNSITSNSLKDAVMHPVASGVNTVYDVPTLYSRNTMSSGTGGNGTAYPNGAVNENGYSLNGSRCYRISRTQPATCVYYMRYTGSYYEGQSNLYALSNGTMTSYVVPAPRYELDSEFLELEDNISGYFKRVRVNGSLNGYYNNSGVLQTGGTCNGGSSCDYYQLVQYDDNNVITQNNYSDYYYLTTRDTNIVFLDGNINAASNTKPLTITGIHNGVNHSTYRVNLTNNSYYSYTGYSLTAGADLRIEYCDLYTGLIEPETSGPSNSSNGYIYGNFYNLKIGRGIPITEGTYSSGWGWYAETYDGTYFNAKGIVGGRSSSTTSNPTKYSLIVESGYYNYISGVSTTSSSATYNVNATVTYGNDFDRIRGNHNLMGVDYNAASSYGGTVTSGSVATPFITTTVKSGTYGRDVEDTAAGIYVGGLNGGTLSSPAEIIVEGGKILYLNGGPLVSSSLTNYNSIYTYIKGGEIDCVFGGAARTETYGNRLINMTGGTVRYSVFGGSNGIEGNNSESSRGTLNGKTFIRIAGNAVVGTATDTVFGIEAGSVFGAGNGNSSYSSIGSVNDSKILIEENATVNKNVYGGGNYGAVVSQNGSSSTTSITVNGGHIKGSVYGGGNNNGSGSSSVTSAINISVNNGDIDASVYGGSRTKGTVYGSTTVNVTGGNVKTDVYGGGEGGYSSDSNPGTYVRDNVSVNISGGTVTGNVYGGSAYGTVNAIDQNTNSSSATTKVTVTGGVVSNSVFGGGKGSSSYTPKVVGDITVTINGGSSGKVFGGFDASGKPSNGDVVYLNSGVVGNAFGGGNNANQDRTDIRLQGSTITGNLYGGSNLLGTVTESNVSVTSGSVVDVFGGNNLDGLTVNTNVTVTGATITGDIYGGGNEAESETSNVLVSGYTDSLQDVYGGGKKAGVTTTNVTIQNDTLHYVFGGSNVSGDVGTSNVHINSSTIANGYGGNNQGGETDSTNIDTKYSQITNVFGGGDNASSGTSNVTIYNGNISNVFGGGNEAGLTSSHVAIMNGTITNVFGGSNESGDLDSSNIVLGSEPVQVNVSMTKRAPGDYPQSTKPTYAEITVTVQNLTDTVIDDWEIVLNVPNSTIFSNYSQSNISVSGDTYTVNSTNRYYGKNTLQPNGSYSFTFSVLSDTALDEFDVSGAVNRPTSSSVSNIHINSLYGGNNHGGVTSSTNVYALAGDVHTIYGGGNEAAVNSTNVVTSGVTADDIYGGGNAAGVTGNTSLDINENTIVTNNVYGGGNEGIVQGNTSVDITDAQIQGNAFAGGNGSTAVVHGNSTITIDGETVIGTPTSEAPNSGCVFGSGNAASTGIEGVDTSKATVNIVGGTIYGNVYGGPKMAVVYGTTDTNIGTSAVARSGLLEDDIHIYGTVFGGGESNASGSETYDWTFISVTKGIDVDIDGTGYIDHNYDFIINGSIFGSGNASSSSGTSNITIKHLGSREQPNKSISIQRANNLVIDDSVIELEGTTDRTNEYSDILYSFNMIDKLVLKNNSVLLLQHNANMLKELYSGVDVNGTLVPATVDIDDDNKSVTKNTDNRIYMLPGQNLNVTINQSATAYGKVTGMTFFGMYTGYENGTYRFGLYDDNLEYGDSGNAGLEIVGGSYVIGLHSVNHDITKDGFYSNYLNDDYTEVTTAYINPSTIGETGYRWIIGFEAINYEFTLNASKYSSLGTYELQLIDFADGNTIFNVIGFDSSGLNPEIQLVDSNNVPRVGRTEAEANNVLGLSMKAETQEWTGYGTTKMLGDSQITGTREYRTDSRKLAPSLMFYLYHAKNINSEGKLGTVVLTLRADIPKNAIDYDIKFITVTINLVAKKYDDADSYDASITYDKRYDMPSSTLVNITNQSQFSTYFSLIAWNDRFENIYGNNNQNYHVLTTNHPLPLNTMITMLDYGANDRRPDYYYFRVTQEVYNDSLQQLSRYNEVVYPLRNFIKMDSTSTNNTYNDQVANRSYYDEEAGLVDEEFMFIFDLKETTTTGDHLDNTMLFELRNHEDRTMFNVLGIREGLMVYNTYESSNVVLEQTITDTDQYLYYNVPDEFNYSTKIQYNQTENRQSVIDTNYESSSMGLNVSMVDKEGVPVSSSMLIGTSIVIDNHEYFADGDGVFRIKLANKVSNLNKIPKITVNKDLPPGEYTIKYTLFASDDGLHNSIYENSVTQEFVVHVVSSDNSIVVDCDDETKIVNGETGLNMDGTKTNTYTVKYSAELNNPNFRIELYKRNTEDPNTTGYTSVPFRTLFSDTFSRIRNNEVYFEMGNENEKSFTYTLQDELTSGTYRIVFKLYDNDQLIDSDEKYVIVNKKSE